MQTDQKRSAEGAIAVIGMSGRYPGSRSIAKFWDNLTAGKETISYYSEQELLNAGMDPELVHDPSFVRARPTYERPMDFDAPFFGYTPREADVIDPQQRIFLECAWEALEDAGYDPLAFPGRIGIFGGAGLTNYLFHLLEDPALLQSRGGLSVFTSNEKDYLATRVGYKLNLRGPCVTMQTACSTSLVSIVFACQSLLDGRSEMAMAGGVTVHPVEKGGYHYHEGGIVSPDGHNRAFDASGKGTIFGSGAGVVVLRRLEDALAAGDNIHAVIRGFGMNNDGSSRVGFTAPGVDGQAAACLEALAMAKLSPEQISYIECHGTATKLGDLVEITALTKAYRTHTEKKQFCAVGSVKTNIGHMDSAAGVAGLTKAVLSLKHEMIPANLHFERPNPEIDFENSPFFVNARLSALERVNGEPLRVAVSSFGVGGTNAHVILEEAPAPEPTSPSRRWQLLTWSARTPTALEKQAANLAEILQQEPEVPLADVAYTLQTGRKIFDQRSILVCQDRDEALRALQGELPGRILSLSRDHNTKSVAFLFPGQGAQHVNMAKEIYENERVFRSEVDHCAELLQPFLGLDLRELLYPKKEQAEAAEKELGKTKFAQPALFTVEYAMARLWEAWGIVPEAMVGHSIGEYVAACLAGVFTLPEALELVATRGRLMQSMPAGSMLGILHPQEEVPALLAAYNTLSVAAANSPSATVVAGPADEVAALEAKLERMDIPCRPLHTSHAFHSAMMDPMLDEFRTAVCKIALQPPQKRYLSNLTGAWATAEDATNPDYWLLHLRNTVRFSENMANLLADPHVLLLEVGPGRTLSSLATQHPAREHDQPVFASLPHPKNDAMGDLQFVMTTAGRLWLEGKPLQWDAFYAGETRRRVSLPTYPFDHESYEIEVAARSPKQAGVSRSKLLDISKWFYYQSWRRTELWPVPQIPEPDGSCLVFLDGCGLGRQIADAMTTAGWHVMTVEAGPNYGFDGVGAFHLRPGEQDDYTSMLAELANRQRIPTAIFHLWGVTVEAAGWQELESHEDYLERGFMSLFYLAPAISQQFGSKQIRLAVVTSNAYNVSDDVITAPTKAAAVGPCRAIPSECPNVSCRAIDISLSAAAPHNPALAGKLVAELFAEPTEDAIAYRGGSRWIQAYEPLPVECPARNPELKRGATYLITGGMGGIGIVLAEAIATIVPANLALFSRSPFPPREEWEELQHGSDLTADKVRRLLRIEELGSRVIVFSADVSDLAAMTAMKAEVEAQFGTVNGVIHSAGVAGAGIMLLKSHAQAMEVLLPKIKGTLVLEELFKESKLDFFMLCSSLNSFNGMGGISDYIGANCFLDAFANSRRNSLNAPLSVLWDSWEDVGMVASGWYDAPKKPAVEALDHALFASRFNSGKTHTYVVHLDPDKHWVVGEHILMGAPTLVGTTHLQLAASAYRMAQSEGPVELRDVLFLVPLAMKGETSREVHVILEETDGLWEFSVKSRKAGSPWQTHALGKVGTCTDAGPAVQDLPSILSRCQREALPVNGTEIAGGDKPFLSFGKRWKNIEEWSFGTDEAISKIRLAPEFADDLLVYPLHPAMLDTATSFAIFKAGTADAQYLPFAYNRVRIYGALSENLYSYARFEKGDSFLSTNLSLLDEQGRPLVQIDGYEVHKISEAIVAGGDPDQIGAEAEGDRLSGPRDHKPKLAKIGARIHSTDGIEVLRRLLTIRDLPQVAVACRALEAVREEIQEVFGARTQSGHGTEQQRTQKMHQRPTLATDYVAPRNDLELALAEIWQSTLGIQGIGVHDDFLELGGNSLLGIQVASRIRTEFEMELSIATFYKSPNIARLAETVLETLQGGLSDAELASALDEIESQGAIGTDLQP